MAGFQSAFGGAVKPRALDANVYATKKSVAQGLLDVALLTANASQLKYLLRVGDRHDFFYPMMVLVCLSIVLQVGEITFKNVYTAYMTVLCKRVSSDCDPKNRSALKWQKCIHKYVLMPNPHFENGSQSFFSLTQKDSRLALLDVVTIRLVLYQPSPLWRKFGLEKFAVYSDPSPEEALRVAVPRLFLSESHGSSASSHQTEDRRKCAASHVQNLWALLEQAKSNKSDLSVGRFEVNGSYDINFLSCN
ncbi:nicolin-1-like isoform X2 [Centruroides sculpturatus]|uniref:nicolin-1-like isoform X2 n=1 Tax=Centruroides sculpturatus TaxID=218467 RepID=UPI000C6EC8B0|nr:nicolin-1-like isoform X2 [Centruroides sculpturatus]